MSTVKLTTTLPDGQGNGLTDLHAHLCDRPAETTVAILLLDTKRLTTDLDTGEVTPTARIVAIEPLPADSVDAVEARRLLRRGYERRTGQTQLPLELERAFDGLGADLTTGELPDDKADDDGGDEAES